MIRMSKSELIHKIEVTGLVVGCAYEEYAIACKKYDILPYVPTITEILRSLRDKRMVGMPLGRLLLWAWCGYIVWHFIKPDK